MEQEHDNSTEDFSIVGFSDFVDFQVPIFASLLILYLLIMLGNLIIIITIYFNTQLHTPMYFFLTNLSFIDIVSSSTIFPPLLAHFFEKDNHFSMTKCLIQTFFFLALLATQVLLLTAMAYDRYVAICNPLRYMVIMNRSVCAWLAVVTWTIGSMEALLYTIVLSEFSFCHSHTINHFFCDVAALLKISCSSTLKIEFLNYIMGTLLAIMTFLLIIISYAKIASSIMKIKTKQGKNKAYSTCGSHLIVIILFFGSLSSNYIRPASTMSMKQNKILSLGYVGVAPLCNPIIYTLKNTEFKNVLRKKKDASNKISTRKVGSLLNCST